MQIANRSALLGIYLSPRPGTALRIGSLVRDNAGTVSFVVDDAYLELGPKRPIISMAWHGRTEDLTVQRLTAREDKIMRGGLLPPFFQNLLPEGALRDLVEAEFGTGYFDDFDVLARLGEDLPGAIVARLEAGQAGGGDVLRPTGTQKPPLAPGRLKFSLAGIQLKFSVLNAGSRGVTAPGRDQHGNVILKTPSVRHPFLPELEHCGLLLAVAVGIRVPECRLVEVDGIVGIASEYLAGGKYALAVDRFDRTPDGGRVHMEDFAQIIGAIGDRKYTMSNEETNLNMIKRFTGDWSGELLEGVRRITANIMLGNGDAHLKNWSFLYMDGRAPELTPAYDLVPTFLYGDGSMALAFGGTRDAARITLHKFERAAGLVKVSPDLLVGEARRTVERILDTWPALLREQPVPDEMKGRIAARWKDLPLVQEVRPTLVTVRGPNGMEQSGPEQGGPRKGPTRL